ncbi:glycosyltransferase family 2 protein [Schleiferia thermophila]|jgi:glycosyltransferase involved in cell wall biosynthesis|uniref:Glycosyltransferase involved in cell wall biosynthesis n=1 Tax=Schleiferia thermophila TaxID=884107 RepID=A0A368ZYE5_9FLAO|nr:glycosyltransferase [Schleiferia thermophila]PMB23782.1 hypothetical protein CEN47_18445 [Fischerella thermalis CCMEE 5319]RCX01953.1 glycosyltransferase involved in cell wall biosynthesis [Schleiferia thermophila]GCD79741.1 hypothetical protein JCM30197_09880 [Schleiferia thermophila]
MPFFSVVIPVYNASPYIEECLHSVIGQSYKDFEIIIVDDASTDDSLHKVRQFFEAFPSFEPKILTHPTNRGLGAARNTGVFRANGQYIAFLDADDYWAITRLEKAASYLEIFPIWDLLYHPVIEFYNGKRRKRHARFTTSLDDLILHGNPLVPSAVVLSRRIALEHPFVTDPAFLGVEDLDLWLRLLQAQIRTAMIPEPLTFYRITTGLTSQISIHLNRCHKVFSRYLKEEYITPAMQRKYYEAARLMQKTGRHLRAEIFYRWSNQTNIKTKLLRLLNRFKIAI